MLFSVRQQARTTLFRLPFLGLAPYVASVPIWWAFIPSALRLAIELLHARPRFAEELRTSLLFVDTIALLFSLSLPSGKKNFLFPLWPLAPRMHLTLFRLLGRNDTLDEVPQKINEKLPLGCFWMNSINKTLLDLFLVAPRES